MNRQIGNHSLHTHTPTLWLQRAMHDGTVLSTKVEGSLNRADLGSKHVEAKVFTQMWRKAGVELLRPALNTGSEVQCVVITHR